MNRESRSQPDDSVMGDEMEYDDQWPPRLPTSSRRYDRSMVPAQDQTIITMHPHKSVPRSAIPARRSAMQPTASRKQTEEAVAPARRPRGGLFRAHPLLWLSVGMLVMLLVWTGLQALGSWWQVHQDDVTYGWPRTAQYDVVVGHNDSPAHPTHLIALNLHATILIIELPGGDVSKAHIYQGPHLYDPGADLFPVTLSFPDPAGNGHPNMEVHVQGQVIVYLNQQGQFVPQGSSH